MRKLSGLILCLLASSVQAAPPLSEESLFTRAIINLDDSRVPRLKLLQQFQQILTQYPDSRRAKHYCVLLSQMVIEDAAHERAGKSISGMTDREKVEEYLFRLRDQEGDQPMEYFLCDPIAYSETKDTPAHELVKLGFVAVPSLIESLHDQRPTRAVGQRRSEYYVLTVGDCAETVLSQIAGRTFFVPTTTTSTMTGDGKTTLVEKSVRAWWQEVQHKGERQVLLEGVVAASDDSAEQAGLLMKLDSRAAVAAMDVAFFKLANPQEEEAFVYVLHADPSPESNALLLKIVKQGKSIGAKTTAGKELLKRGDGSVIKTMTEAWRQWLESGEKDPNSHIDMRDTIEFLADCGKLEGTNALRERYEAVPAGVCYEIMQHLGRIPEAPMEVQEAQEAFLVEALSDRRVGPRSYSGFEDYRYVSPRICDQAAMSLRYSWPEKYPYHWLGTRVERDIACAELHNQWRKSKGMEAVPLPVLPSIAAAASEANSIARITWNGAEPLPGFPLKGGDVITLNNASAAIDFLHTNIPEEWLRIDVAIERPEGNTGVVVEVTVAQGKPTRKGQWVLWDDIYARRSLLDSYGGTCSAVHKNRMGVDRDGKKWNQWLSQIFATEPGESFSICLQTIRME